MPISKPMRFSTHDEVISDRHQHGGFPVKAFNGVCCLTIGPVGLNRSYGAVLLGPTQREVGGFGNEAVTAAAALPGEPDESSLAQVSCDPSMALP